MAISSFVDGVWISGASPPTPSTAGFTLLQLSGVWISGAPAPAPAPAPSAAGFRSVAFWLGLSGAAFTPEPVHPPGVRGRSKRQQILDEDEEIMAIIMAFLEMNK